MCDGDCKMDGKWGCHCLNQAMNHMLFSLICPTPRFVLAFCDPLLFILSIFRIRASIKNFDSQKLGLKIKLYSLLFLSLSYYT